MKEVFDYIDSHFDEYLEELFGFLRCTGISTQNIGVQEAAEHLANIMRSSGIPRSAIRWYSARSSPTLRCPPS